MIATEIIKEIGLKMNVSVSELTRKIGHIAKNFSKKLKREKVSLD